MKDFLSYENERNKKNAALYQAIIKKALGEDNDVLVGHHLCFESNGQIATENEIPSADTLMFDHEIMHRVFPGTAHQIMRELATATVEHRDNVLRQNFMLMYPDSFLEV